MGVVIDKARKGLTQTHREREREKKVGKKSLHMHVIVESRKKCLYPI